jgi:hypothetical protein
MSKRSSSHQPQIEGLEERVVPIPGTDPFLRTVIYDMRNRDEKSRRCGFTYDLCIGKLIGEVSEIPPD